jgi:hypothetical protein
LNMARKLGHYAGAMRWHILLSVLVLFPPLGRAQGFMGDRDIFLPQVTAEAAASGIPPEIADAVAMVETGYQPGAVGSSGEIGIMQILPSTAAQLGFHGSLDELREPSVNIHLAVQYLARAWADSAGDICKALTKYRAGLGETVTSPLSAQYCNRAIAWLLGRGSHVGIPAGYDTTGVLSAAADPHVISIQQAMAVQQQAASVQVLGPPKQAEELYYPPLTAQPIEAAQVQPSYVQAMPPPAPPPRHTPTRRHAASRVAALQASLDAHARVVGNGAVTSFDTGN